MTEIRRKHWSESDQEAIRHQLDRILNSGPFRQSQRRQRFLEYLVNETLAGRTDRLKGYNVALEVFDRPETFDPILDPVVRIEASRLREKLREYYGTEGQSDSIHIDLPKGTYAPLIEFLQGEQQVNNISKPVRVYRVPADPRPISQRAALAKIGWTRLAMLAAALLLIIAAGSWGLQGWNSGPSLPDKPSIAVLPFDNIGDDPQWERFADGITEDIIADLSHSKDLIVIARNSTAVYEGKPVDIRQIGGDLRVKYVLEGSIQSMGEQNSSDGPAH